MTTERIDDIMTQYTQRLAQVFVRQKDEIIMSVLPEQDRSAIPFLIQEHLDMLIKHRGQVICSPDGVETFCWDGKPLISFMPMAVEIIRNELIVRQRIQYLNEELPS